MKVMNRDTVTSTIKVTHAQYLKSRCDSYTLICFKDNKIVTSHSGLSCVNLAKELMKLPYTGLVFKDGELTGTQLLQKDIDYFLNLKRPGRNL